MRLVPAAAALLTLSVLLAGCAGSGNGSTTKASDQIVLLTHDSFQLDKNLLSDFEKQSGVKVVVQAVGDAGTLANQLVLQKGQGGDVMFGVDNTFSSRVESAGVIDGSLTPIDYGDVCVNVDHTWFTKHNLAEPSTLQDLAKPEYKNLLVVENPASSSPGLAFLLGTIGAFGPDGWQDYWTSLKDNGVEVAASWTDAYSVDFSGSSGHGPRPLVVSYSSSPPDEVADPSAPAPTGALLNTCFRQTEYAGVLSGTKNPTAAQEFVDFLLSDAVQKTIPTSMYMYPVDTNVALPEDWQKYAPLSPNPYTVDPADIEKNRDSWIDTWTNLVVG